VWLHTAVRSVVLPFHVQKSHVQLHEERPSILIEDFCGIVLSHQANVGILLHIKPWQLFSLCSQFVVHKSCCNSTPYDLDQLFPKCASRNLRATQPVAKGSIYTLL
jgi:hypothetical protein